MCAAAKTIARFFAPCEYVDKQFTVGPKQCHTAVVAPRRLVDEARVTVRARTVRPASPVSGPKGAGRRRSHSRAWVSSPGLLAIAWSAD